MFRFQCEWSFPEKEFICKFLKQLQLLILEEIFNNFEKLFDYCANLNDYLVKHQ